MSDLTSGAVALGVRRAWRAITALVGFGHVAGVDSGAGVQTFQIAFGAAESRDGVPDIAHYGFTSAPPPSARAVVVFANGDRGNGVAVATNDAASRKTGLASGEVAVYDNLGQTVYLTRSGIVIDAGANPVTVRSAGTVTVDAPLLSCTGDITSNTATDPVTLAQVRATFNGHEHPFAGGDTGVPTQLLP